MGKKIAPLFECYAIRQNSTGKYLPMRWKKARGYSYDEPSYGFPRLFRSERSAHAALTAWLRGVWSEPETEFDDWSLSENVVGYSPVKKEGRNREDMEVVRFYLRATPPGSVEQ